MSCEAVVLPSSFSDIDVIKGTSCYKTNNILVLKCLTVITHIIMTQAVPTLSLAEILQTDLDSNEGNP